MLLLIGELTSTAKTSGVGIVDVSWDGSLRFIFLVASLTALAKSSMSFNSMFMSDNSSPAWIQIHTRVQYAIILCFDAVGLATRRESRLRHLSTLQWCWRDGRTSVVTLPSTRPGAAGVMAKSPLSKRPKTPMELPGEDRGGDLSPSPRPGMRERGGNPSLCNKFPVLGT